MPLGRDADGACGGSEQLAILNAPAVTGGVSAQGQQADLDTLEM